MTSDSNIATEGPTMGVIKKLTDRGFGFIAAEGQGEDIFFHGKSLVDSQFDDLREGDLVEFRIEVVEKRIDDKPRRLIAVDVKRA